jgi:2-keto-4-pentenoate hydratase
MPGLAQALARSHRSGIPIESASLAAPVDFDAAMQVQADVLRTLAAETAGWKVGMAPASETAVAAPIFRHLLLPNAGAYAHTGATFLAIEVEVGFHLRSDIRSGGDVPSALGAAFVGIEIVRSRLVEGSKAPYPLFLADNIGNGGYLVGPERRDWATLDLSQLRCEVWRDDALIHDAVGGHPQKHPLNPLHAYAARPIDKLGGLRKNQIVTTGTLCGLVFIDAPCRIRARLQGFGEVSVEIVP